MKYPKEYLDEIKLRLKVSQVVGKSVQLKKRGKEFIGLSPFKNEKTPSFTVNDDKGFYHCFSSSEHGNIFDFLMKTKSIGFGEAVKILAAEAGMQPYRFSNFDKKKDLRFQVYKKIFQSYSSFFHEQLFYEDNKAALDYLSNRGFKKDTIKNFQIGYVPWKNNFYNQLLKSFSEEEISLTGLYYKNEKTGNFVDRFNSRILFPVNNISGDTIAFGGRIIKEGKLAKYINSPETEFYKKGNMIFNLDKAKDCRSETNEVIIVEGYMDVVSVYSSGIKNVISNSGTAITEKQINLIWKFFSNPIICLDGDESGQNAAYRISEKLFPYIDEKNKIFFSIMPEGKDPDDLIKKEGKNVFIDVLKQKKIIQDFIWNYQMKKVDQYNPFEVSRFEKEIKRLCYSIKDETIKKYVFEDFLEKLKTLTPLQDKENIFNYSKYKKFRNYKVLNETKVLHKKRENLSKIEIIEFSLLFIISNFLHIASNKINELKNLRFSSDRTEDLRNFIASTIVTEEDNDKAKVIIMKKYSSFLKDIEENSNIKLVTKNKNDQEILELLNELINDFIEQSNLKKIESLEKKLINNLDENSYSELLRLKSQLNRD